MESIEPKFDWQRCSRASAWVQSLLESIVGVLPFASELQRRMREETGTRLIDWVDQLVVPEGNPVVSGLEECGFKPKAGEEETVWSHPGGLFPAIRVGEFDSLRIVLKVDSVSDFLIAHRLDGKIAGAPLSSLRQAEAVRNDAAALWVVERHGNTGNAVIAHEPQQLLAAASHRESFDRRRRVFESEAEGFEHAGELIDAAREDLGIDWTCALFFAAERRYWESRNHAARVQKSRQDRLGLGWANHDHHTYRSSRECFTLLIDLLEQLGFHCRERFYGGAEAGWGAQVLEQPVAGIVVFADVDLTPTEVTGDFAHDGLEAGDSLGTVGLWCRLHGEAMLQAGMHHLECQFDFDAARAQLAQVGVTTMKPFTDFDHLKQAFTEGEIWETLPHRVDEALRDELITETQARRFHAHGSIGSHLEILQRDDGYKGFNQTGISEIIRETDPRQIGQ